MSQLLAANPEHIQTLCTRLGLGVPQGAVTRVYGGFHHTMWRLVTDQASYAVKRLAADTDLGDPAIIAHYNMTEAIAERFAGHGVPAVYALQWQCRYLQIIGDTAYLVHPWSDAAVLDQDQISEQHGLKIARILATMHRANLEVPDLPAPPFEIHPEQKIRGLVRAAAEAGLQFAQALDTRLDVFLGIVAAQKVASTILQQHSVVSHGDLDQKNVLWDASDSPLLIDWESARKLNPTYEIVLAALDWSGFSSSFDHSLFGKMIAAYAGAGGVIEAGAVDAALRCILGDWLHWLMYNLGRCVYLDDAEQRRLGAQQIEFTLPIVLRLQRQLPELLSLFENGYGNAMIRSTAKRHGQ